MAMDLRAAQKDLEDLLVHICDAKMIPQSNNDNGEYAEKVTDKMDEFKRVINFALNLQERAENEAIRLFAADFLGVVIVGLENNRHSCVDFRAELSEAESSLRELISAWNPSVLELDIIQEMR